MLPPTTLSLDLPTPPTPAEIAWTIAQLRDDAPPTPRTLEIAMWLVGWDAVPDANARSLANETAESAPTPAPARAREPEARK